METLTGTTIFWLLALGSLTGWIVGYVMGHEGRPLYSNIVWGTAGSLSVGLVALWLNLGGVLLFAFMGTLATLFITNVFHTHHTEDISEGEDLEITLRRYRKGAKHS
ncbi:MAG: hypothetical protein PVH63_13435 [Balneolaceae bacterium]